MRIGSRPFGLIRSIIDSRSSTYSITRETTKKSDIGETVKDSDSSHNVDIWLHQPGEANIETERGERLVGDLLGLSTGDPDLEVNDTLTYNGETYSIDDIIYYPSDSSIEYTKFSLVRVTP